MTTHFLNKGPDCFRAVESFFEKQTCSDDGPISLRLAKKNHRLWCFRTGLDYCRYVTETKFNPSGRRVLDLACAWGGHALSFASQGAVVIASDIKDHRFSQLQRFAYEQKISLACINASCENLPLNDSSFDVILALDLVEHISDVSRLAREVKRLLKKGGVCIITTPPRLRSLIVGEPHWGLRGITFMPLFLQEMIAKYAFGRKYPFPINRQYMTAAQVLYPFESIGLLGAPYVGGRFLRYLRGWPQMLKLASFVWWDFIRVEKSIQT